MQILSHDPALHNSGDIRRETDTLPPKAHMTDHSDHIATDYGFTLPRSIQNIFDGADKVAKAKGLAAPKPVLHNFDPEAGNPHEEVGFVIDTCPACSKTPIYVNHVGTPACGIAEATCGGCIDNGHLVHEELGLLESDLLDFDIPNSVPEWTEVDEARFAEASADERTAAGRDLPVFDHPNQAVRRKAQEMWLAKEAKTAMENLEAAASTDLSKPPSWGKVDLTTYLDGTYTPPVPTVFTRGDGKSLFYRGLTHSCHGESESGKSLMLQIEAAKLLSAGEFVLFIDFESDPGSVVGRLREFGATIEDIRERFDYRQPEVRPRNARELAEWDDMMAGSYSLAVIDGVTVALGVFGYSTNDNDEVTKWAKEMPERIAKETGAAVVLVDHVSKSADTRGRFQIGAQAKTSTLTGASYVVEPTKPLGRGLSGEVHLRVAKDRAGAVRPVSGPMRASDRTQLAAVVTVDSTGPSPVVTIAPPDKLASETPGGVEETGPFRPTTLMERASKVLEDSDKSLSKTALAQATGGKTETTKYAVQVLADEGYIAGDDSTYTKYTVVTPYREDSDPVLNPSGTEGTTSLPNWP